MKKALGITAATLVVLVLIASFVVYPSLAASTARDQIIQGISTVAESADVKVSGVTVDVDGGNGISALTGGNKVGDISVKIDRIELPEGATSGAPPQLKPGDEDEAADGVREILDAIEDVGSVKLTVGEVTSGPEKLPLNDSSIKISDGAWELALKVPQSAVTELLQPLGITLTATASGQTIKSTVKLGDLPKSTFSITLAPTDQGRAIAYNVDGDKGTQRISKDDDVRVTKLQFSSANGLYSVDVGGTYDYEAVRAEIEKELDAVS
jgi:hypothetical protein